MDSFKAVFFKPDPKEQKRKCADLIRQNQRGLDREIQRQTVAINQTKTRIKADYNRAQKNPSQRNEALKSVRTLAQATARAQKGVDRLRTNKAQLESVRMQVNEQFAMKQLQTSLKSSTDIMKLINSVQNNKLPELSRMTEELSRELMKAGVIEEMTHDMLPDDELEEDTIENDAEVNKIIADALGKENAQKYMGDEEATFPTAPEAITQEEEPAPEISEADIANMRLKLEALKS